MSSKKTENDNNITEVEDDINKRIYTINNL